MHKATEEICANTLCFVFSGLANSKGLRHLVESGSLPAKDAELEEREEEEETGAVVEAVTEGTSSSPHLSVAKRSRSSRQVLREVLDGVVDPEILDSCVEDLELITAHSGTKLCELVRATHQWRNAQDATDSAAAVADTDLNRSGVSISQPSLPTLIPTDGTSCFTFCYFTVFTEYEGKSASGGSQASINGRISPPQWK